LKPQKFYLVSNIRELDSQATENSAVALPADMTRVN